MWEQGLLDREFIENLREITRRSAPGWRELGLVWIAHGGFRREIEKTLEELGGGK